MESNIKLSIINGTVARDNRDGVNNAKMSSDIDDIEKDVCIFTHPNGSGLELRLEFGTNTILINLNQAQLHHLNGLIQPYLDYSLSE
jgi:hypothetical protein